MIQDITLDSIVCTDVLDGLRRIPDQSIHLVVTSPPFNVGINYDKHIDTMPHVDYLAWMHKIWVECFRVLVHGGRICINIDATMNLEEGGAIERVHPLHVDFTNQLRDIGYIYRAEICWTKQNAPGKDTAWGSYASCSNPHIRRNSEYIVIASKGDLRLDGDPMMCDLTKEEFHQWTLSEWKIKPETSKKGHPVPYPYELIKRCIKLFSYVGNTVLDPFSGSGTTCVVAVDHGRHYIGLDNSERYCQAASERIKNSKKCQTYEPYKFTPAPVICAEAQEQKKANNKRIDLFASA